MHGGPVRQVQAVLICATACEPAHRSGAGIDLALPLEERPLPDQGISAVRRWEAVQKE